MPYIHQQAREKSCTEFAVGAKTQHTSHLHLPLPSSSLPTYLPTPSHPPKREETLHNDIGPLDPPPRRPDPTDAPLLIPAQPRLLRLAQDLLADKIHHQPHHDHHERNRIQEIDGQAKHLDANHHAPEIAGEEGDVEKGGRRKAEDERGERVEERETQRIPDQIATDLAVPGGGLEGGAIEDARLGAVDDHAPEAHLADDLVEGPLGDEEFLRHVGEAVEGGAEEGEEVAFELVGSADVAAVGAGDVVRGEQEAHAADADQDAGHLGDVVSDAQGEEGDEDDDDDGPEVDELGAEDGGVAVGEHGEVVAFDVHEGEDEVLVVVMGG